MTGNALKRSAVIGALLATQSACSIYSLPGQTPAPIEEPGGAPVTESASGAAPDARDPAPAPVEREREAAYGPLIDRAAGAADRGDYEEALRLLERAQRIDPASAEVYLALAQTHSARGDRLQARATAERGLLYCREPARCAALRVYAR